MAAEVVTEPSRSCLALAKVITQYITYFFWPTPVIKKSSDWGKRQPFIRTLQASNLIEKHCGIAILMHLNKTEDYLSPQETQQLAVLLRERGRFVTHKELLVRQSKALNKSIVSRLEILEILVIEQRLIFSRPRCN
ncbi:hypothetical protein H112_00536 [Trichophyton rubrum D6]|uniref:Uncharacterized protein n=3 Tax=Trichophyton TaxID=5550 RepID=F2T010_TRIRC|nr:uncharacterized protein TERG_08148 [Trichophyton rubrum CBS 118892]EZF27435.1 hypothetical protein H100_00535 [Trichophyton rubrum MR850]EZF46465.1 hypothetical protein H102_00535 [Trichophyton rubrum CBS 100081]EZF57123.1 hypothetical protein H103_00535 [Trichophyton rubrum CBS 288.86]EZF67692.1 hypothetical protein H104_00525 [Trichophyton rubrum CBS 289.86]EZF78366.1 hypothetical protein H105_00523 [Trichophyton soudanense CBS 452.61]EZF89062.1 hypothetical protein H110_00539 [Trichophy